MHLLGSSTTTWWFVHLPCPSAPKCQCHACSYLSYLNTKNMVRQADPFTRPAQLQRQHGHGRVHTHHHVQETPQVSKSTLWCMSDVAGQAHPFTCLLCPSDDTLGSGHTYLHTCRVQCHRTVAQARAWYVLVPLTRGTDTPACVSAMSCPCHVGV